LKSNPLNSLYFFIISVSATHKNVIPSGDPFNQFIENADIQHFLLHATSKKINEGAKVKILRRIRGKMDLIIWELDNLGI